MGCDGGSIPRRDEMVKLKKKAEKAEKAIELAAKWRHCALSSEKLQQPIVGCELGRLYNKETVLMALLDKTNIPEIAKHLRSLKDVVELQLTANPVYKPNDKADTYNDMHTAEFICPVTGIHMNGMNRFVFFRNCGCVISEKGMKEVPSSVCHKCGMAFTKEDVITINGSDEEIERQRVAMEERRQAVRLSKRKRKMKSDQQQSTAANSSEQSSSSSNSPVDGETLVEKKPKTMPVPVTKPVKKTKSKLSTKSPHGNGLSQGVEERDAYKALFTSSVPERPKEQTSHWVTFFPYH